MSDEVRRRLHDAREACQAIRRFTSGRSFGDYEGDEMLRSAVERQFEILGEALNQAGRLDPGLHERFPDLRRIVALRNRIIHGYDSVDDEIMWDLVQHRVPELEQIVDGVLGP